MHNLVKQIQAQRIAPDDGATTTFTLAAGTSDKNSVGVDTRGWRGLLWIVIAGTMAASSSLDVKAQQSSDNGSSDAFDDLAGTAATQVGATDDDKTVIIDIGNPGKRYQRLAFTRGDGGNSTIDAVIAVLYNPDDTAIQATAHSTNKSTETFSNPAEGTA